MELSPDVSVRGLLAVLSSRDCNVSVSLLVFNKLISKKALSWEFFQHLIQSVF